MLSDVGLAECSAHVACSCVHRANKGPNCFHRHFELLEGIRVAGFKHLILQSSGYHVVVPTSDMRAAAPHQGTHPGVCKGGLSLVEQCGLVVGTVFLAGLVGVDRDYSFAHTRFVTTSFLDWSLP